VHQNPERITARGIRKVQKSMQFDGQDVAALFGGFGLDDTNSAAGRVLGDQDSDVHQVDIEISDKRENADRIEYHVRKKIIFDMWVTLENLKMKNLHEFVEIFDRKRNDTTSVGKSILQHHQTLDKQESTSRGALSASHNGLSAISNDKSYDEVELLQQSLEKNSIPMVEKELPNETKSINPEFREDTDESKHQPPSILVPLDSATEDSDIEKVSTNWFDRISDENYDFSSIPSSENFTTKVCSPLNTPSEKSLKSHSQSSEILFGGLPANAPDSSPGIISVEQLS